MGAFPIGKKKPQGIQMRYLGKMSKLAVEFMNDIFIKLESKLKDNGSFFFFHNNFRIMAELDRLIQKNTSFMFRNFIIWNKRFEGSPKKGFLDGYVVKNGLNSFNKMAEYIMFYTFDNSWKLKEERI